MNPLVVTKEQIDETLTHLKVAGTRYCECVVLWLGKHEGDAVRVTRVYRPEQIAQADMFKIPHQSMNEIMEILSDHELMIAAQVHSHPYEAFHSRADDHWAIVRHVNALSLVVPYFAQQTDHHSWFDHTKVFQLDSKNHWIELSDAESRRWISVQ